MRIRNAEINDIPEIVELCRLHAAYEKSAFDDSNKARSLEELIFKKKVIKCIVVEDAGMIFGYASFMKQYSTWDACAYMYLCCLYLREQIRGQGIGRKIMYKVKEIAKTENCAFLQWQTPSHNQRGIHFYNKIGASSINKERFTWEV